MKNRFDFDLPAAAIVIYLLGAFYSVSFNIGMWNQGTRFVCCMAFVICCGLYYIKNNPE